MYTYTCEYVYVYRVKDEPLTLNPKLAFGHPCPGTQPPAWPGLALKVGGSKLSGEREREERDCGGERKGGGGEREREIHTLIHTYICIHTHTHICIYTYSTRAPLASLI